ncbi:P-type conjugative transfer ATPase TrbB, partial [Fusobacterium polymorphum]
MSEFFDKRKESENRLLDFFYDSLGEENTALLEDDDVIELYINDDKKVWIDTLSSGRHFTGRYME